ncbi:MAG: hypothetical protein NC420_11880 [Eubacterium sp.]|nr:hypothetical protein [Eubacterium sp.]MCM1213019.1 hypothetical protein [Lachnospiraceae bacterium]MCM1241113.1 hypothetical protein [Lachnospiraceae bacterium]
MRRSFLLLVISMFMLSGCGQTTDLPDEAADSSVSQTADVSTVEQSGMTKEDEKEDEAAEPSESLPAMPEVPVNTQAEDMDYDMSDGIDPANAADRCCSDGEKIYLAYGRPDLYIMQVGANEHSRMNIDNPEELLVCNVTLDPHGKLHLLMVSRDNEQWMIWRLDQEGQVEEKLDISAYIETKFMPRWFLVVEDGTYLLQWVLERNGILVDSGGALKHTFTPESLGVSWTYETAVGKDGRIYFAYGEGDDKIRIGEFDMENFVITKEDSSLYFSRDEIFAEMSGGTDTNLLLYSHYSGIWAYDREEGILENRVPLGDIQFDSSMESCPLAFLPDGRLLLIGRSIGNCHIKYIPAGK